MGPIVQKFEQRGFKLIAMKICSPGLKKFEEHYLEHADKPFFERLTKWAAQGPILAMVWEGDNVIKTGRKIIGATNDMQREMGSIRGDMSASTQMNIVHGSDNIEAADREIKLWFKEQELVNWDSKSQKWIYE